MLLYGKVAVIYGAGGAVVDEAAGVARQGRELWAKTSRRPLRRVDPASG